MKHCLCLRLHAKENERFFSVAMLLLCDALQECVARMRCKNPLQKSVAKVKRIKVES